MQRQNLEQEPSFLIKITYRREIFGLIYCETGRIGDALRHWIISSSLLPEGNAAAGYMAYLQKNAREMEKCNDAVRMYNQAITYLKQGSDDLAIIQLKNPLTITRISLMPIT